jgi:hypothetical protein
MLDGAAAASARTGDLHRDADGRRVQKNFGMASGRAVARRGGHPRRHRGRDEVQAAVFQGVVPSKEHLAMVGGPAKGVGDWAMLKLLWHYAWGDGKTLRIVNDSDWAKYMMDNEKLRRQVLPYTLDVAWEALSEYQAGDVVPDIFFRTFAAEMENGQLTGYQWLHGTSSFSYFGEATVTPNADGTFQVTVNSSFVWKDRIDTNANYHGADEAANFIVDALTLGNAEFYDVRIDWSSQSQLTLRADGGVLAASGYPFR